MQPGDVKYVDVNQDGVIDDYDMVPIGYTPYRRLFTVSHSERNIKDLISPSYFSGADNVSIKYFGRSMQFSRKEKRVRNL